MMWKYPGFGLYTYCKLSYYVRTRRHAGNGATRYRLLRSVRAICPRGFERARTRSKDSNRMRPHDEYVVSPAEALAGVAATASDTYV